MNTFWVTFYSYKGGVGRTMALANVAAVLAKEGRRVLLIDFDLEAPGLDAFEGLGCAKGNAGVVEYVAEYLATGKAPSIHAFVRECQPSSTHLRGKLWLMPSGRKDHEYNRNRARINWTDLYDKYDGERFVENWKADIEKSYSPDYVLIDSRTGLTDVGGICTLHLPQLVVLLYALNDQNIHGIAGVARAVSKAENTRPPQLLTVASPVPPTPKEKSGLLQERLDMAEKELGIKPHCQIHYDSRVPLKEQVIVWEDPYSRLGTEYGTLRELIADYDVRGLDFLIKESQRAISELDAARAQEAGVDLLREYSDRPECYHQLARIARAFGKIEEIEPHLKKAVDLDPFYSPPSVELVGLLKVQNRHQEAIEIEKRRLTAIAGKRDKRAEDGVRYALGQLCMMAGEYSSAIEVYAELPRTATDDQEDDLVLLANAFNYAEARRRAGEVVPISELKEIVTLYERGAATEGSGPVVMRLNHMQAMHIPYALMGEAERSRQLLMQVEELATSISPRERIFSVSTYKDLPTSEFLKQNKEMIDALNQGKLWDGTRIPNCD
ncbi:AAA family ATPase [Prosthecobacter sp.]|uniref:KGGVGR-motif variant AAA ATPase n=1 Tax=Prosthecobacter sp. TaxID=1965333 RepID=UPI001E19EB18|nr:AAA family ATPase [Prosthecobacter sp.]MCB1276045.1 AAA family ATPase [Prosthecobacter sp.]